MSGNALGGARGAAKRIGIDYDEYANRVASGEKRCTGCKRWHPRDRFVSDRSRSDGLKTKCRDCDRMAPRQFVLRAVFARRGDIAATRGGDKKQARARVNYLIQQGRLPRPNDLPCTDCGHVWHEGERRHEYDHYLGYGAEHQRDVQAVCTKCHHARERSRA